MGPKQSAKDGAAATKSEARRAARAHETFVKDNRKTTRRLDQLNLDDADTTANDDKASGPSPDDNIGDDDIDPAVLRSAQGRPPPRSTTTATKPTTTKSTRPSRAKQPTDHADDEENAVDEADTEATASGMPGRRGSTKGKGRAQGRRPSAATTTKANSKWVIDGNEFVLPEGVTIDQVRANVDILHIAQEIANGNQPLPPTVAPRSTPVPQVDIDPAKLPCEIALFCNNRQFTRGIIFNLGRVTSIQAVKNLVTEYFGMECARVEIPADVYFCGLHLIKDHSPNKDDYKYYGCVVEDEALTNILAQITEVAMTGQLVHIHVSLFTPKQLGEDMQKFQSFVADGEEADLTDVDVLKWHLNHPKHSQFADPRTFELNRDDEQTIEIPAHEYRENKEKARIGNLYRDNFGAADSAKAAIRNEEFEIRTTLTKEIRGLRQILHKEGFGDLDMEVIDAATKESEEQEAAAVGGRAQHTGQRSTWQHLKELAQEVEDKSDRFAGEEAAIFRRTFLQD
jgi:hypothetical protein